jgi:hypothetical protein
MAVINLVLAVFLLLVASIVLGLVWLRREIASSNARLPITADWINELSADRYLPMLRLLQSDELTFLKSQPGFTASEATRFRVERARVFRGYLRCLHADFRLISMALRVFMVQSRDDRPDLARVLIRRRCVYTVAAALVHLRLFLYELGVCSVDATSLMRTFEALRLELHGLLPKRAAA